MDPVADIVEVAQRLADDVLFPAALATDASDTVPGELLDGELTALRTELDKLGPGTAAARAAPGELGSARLSSANSLRI